MQTANRNIEKEVLLIWGLYLCTQFEGIYIRVKVEGFLVLLKKDSR